MGFIIILYLREPSLGPHVASCAGTLLAQVSTAHTRSSFVWIRVFLFRFPGSVEVKRGTLRHFPLSPATKGNRTKDQAEREISATELNMLPCLYPWSINVVVYHDPSGRSHLGRGLALRCFQRLSFPDVATQQCR